MSTIVTRAVKGTALTYTEMDANFNNLNTDKLEAGTPGTNIANTPAGGISAVTVQAAINELDTEKANLASPVFTGNPTAPTPTVGDNDTSIATTAFVASTVAPFSGKNYIINGGCVVAQRGNVAAVLNSWTYGGSDRIAVQVAGTTGSGTIQRYSGATWTSTGYAQKVQATTTGVGGIYFQQRVESFNTVGLNSKQVTVSCLVYQNTGSAQNAAIVIGKPTTTADVFSAQTALSTSGNFSIPSGTATAISWTYTLGAAEATLGLYAQAGFANVGAVTAKDFIIGDFKLETGSIATPFVPESLDEALAACQRYYQETPIECVYQNTYCVVATSNFVASYSYPVTMRALPTITAPSWSLTQCNTPVLTTYSEQSISYYGSGTTASGTVAFSNSTPIKLSIEL